MVKFYFFYRRPLAIPKYFFTFKKKITLDRGVTQANWLS